MWFFGNAAFPLRLVVTSVSELVENCMSCIFRMYASFSWRRLSICVAFASIYACVRAYMHIFYVHVCVFLFGGFMVTFGDMSLPRRDMFLFGNDMFLFGSDAFPFGNYAFLLRGDVLLFGNSMCVCGDGVFLFGTDNVLVRE